MITLHQFQAVGDLRCQSKNRGVSCFSGFPCRDASLRDEGCFFLVPAGRSLLRSRRYQKETEGAALASRQGFFLFLLELNTFIRE